MKHWQFCLCLETLESPIGQLLPSLESHVPLCLSSPPCLPCPCSVQTVCCSSGLPPNLFLLPVPCFSRSFLLLQRCSLHLPWCSYATSLIFLHSQPHVLIHSPCSPETRSPLYLIRLLFSPSPLVLPAFGAQDRVLSAHSSCA